MYSRKEINPDNCKLLNDIVVVVRLDYTAVEVLVVDYIDSQLMMLAIEPIQDDDLLSILNSLPVNRLFYQQYVLH
jgi:hypothetical protein